VQPATGRNDPVAGFFFWQGKGRNEVKQVKRLSLAMLLISSALVATAAPAFAQSGTFADPDQRRLLGMGILALTLIIALLMALFLPMGSNSTVFRRWVSKSRRIKREEGDYGDVAYRSVAPSPDAKKIAVLSPNGVAKAHDIPSDEEAHQEVQHSPESSAADQEEGEEPKRTDTGGRVSGVIHPIMLVAVCAGVTVVSALYNNNALLLTASVVVAALAFLFSLYYYYVKA
jgi:hypothetical protein